MGERPAETEGVHPRTPRGFARRPRCVLSGDGLYGGVDGQCRINLIQPGNPGNLSLPEHEHGLDQPDESGCPLQVPDVGLDRPDPDAAVRPGGRPAWFGRSVQGTDERIDLHGVAVGRSGAVGLQVPQVTNPAAGTCCGTVQQLGL
ncbi:hypothetical protein GCM10022402_38060 [Salinactinospora qingdaonensis]|uniref:Superoxide dismutase, Cu-Zn family n=1 Tax=Salinactinospora qingdaonensis TaxID=702744 RepID=A0ABP7G7Q5_9ACTN